MRDEQEITRAKKMLDLIMQRKVGPGIPQTAYPHIERALDTLNWILEIPCDFDKRIAATRRTLKLRGIYEP